MLLARAQTCALAVENSECNAHQQQVDEGLPISLSDFDSCQSDDEPSDENVPVLAFESAVPNDDICLSASCEFQARLLSVVPILITLNLTALF